MSERTTAREVNDCPTCGQTVPVGFNCEAEQRRKGIDPPDPCRNPTRDQQSERERLREAVRFLTECELATVEYMDGLSNPTKSQLERHREIAREGLRVLSGESLERDVTSTPRVDAALNREDPDA